MGFEKLGLVQQACVRTLRLDPGFREGCFQFSAACDRPRLIAPVPENRVGAGLRNQAWDFPQRRPFAQDQPAARTLDPTGKAFKTVVQPP